MMPTKKIPVESVRDIKDLVDFFETQESKYSVNRRYDLLDKELPIHVLLNSYEKAGSEDDKVEFLSQLKRLLNLGADPNQLDRKSSSPALHRAIELKSMDLIEVLLGSELLKFDKGHPKTGKTAVLTCIEHCPRCINLIKFLSEKNNHELQTLFLEAISAKDKEKIKYFIDNKLVDFNRPCSEGRLPLHLLCLMGDVELLVFVRERLKANQIRVECAKLDDFQNSALHYACNPWGNPNPVIIRWLFRKGCDPNQPDQHGEYPLHQIVELQNPQFVELLLHQGADPRCRDGLGRTALGKILTRPELQNNSSMLTLLMTDEPPIQRCDPVQLSYEEGFWIRVIGAYTGRRMDHSIQRECAILSAREQLSYSDLGRTRSASKENGPYYYSPATFVKSGLSISLFSSDKNKFAVIIQTPGTIHGWCSGLYGEPKTDVEDVNFSESVLKFKGYSDEHQLGSTTSTEVAIKLVKLVKKYVCSYSPIEKYEWCTDPSSLMWNEGLFRYKKEDIKGLVLLSITAQSVRYALRFEKECGLRDLPFYRYAKSREIVKLSREKVVRLVDSVVPNPVNSSSFMRPPRASRSGSPMSAEPAPSPSRS